MAGVHLIIDEDDYLVNETAKSLYGDGTGLEVVDSATSTNAVWCCVMEKWPT